MLWRVRGREVDLCESKFSFVGGYAEGKWI